MNEYCTLFVDEGYRRLRDDKCDVVSGDELGSLVPIALRCLVW